MSKKNKYARMAVLIRALIVFAPLAIAYAFDRSLSGCGHIPIIGISAVAVALCDALFGQIVSQTAWIPFAPYHTPAEAADLVKQFDGFHRQTFVAWMVTKLFSGLAVVLSAVLAVLTKDGHVFAYTGFVLSVGYLALGISICGVVFFLSTYFQARNASNKAKLEEIAKRYEELNKNAYAGVDEASLKEVKKTLAKYNSPPQTL